MSISGSLASFADSQVHATAGTTKHTNLPVAVQLQSGIGDHGNRSALLIVVSRRDFGNQVIRPMATNFNPAVQNELVNIVNTQDVVGVSREVLAKNQVLAQAILPSSGVCHHVTMTQYREIPTFLLVINNTGNSNTMGINTSLPTREVYTGWIANGGESPISSNNTINPNAVLSISHSAKFSIFHTGGVGVGGPVGAARIVREADVDLISDDQIGAIQTTNDKNSNRIHTLGIPEMCMQAVMQANMASANFGDPTVLSETVVATAPRAGADGAVTVSSTDNKNQVHQLLDLARAARSAIDENTVVNNLRSNVVNNTLENGVHLASLTRASDTLPSGLSIDPREVVTIGQLSNRFGAALNVLALHVPYDVSYDRIDPAHTTPQNVAASIVQNAMPSLLSTHGIADLAFTYDSTMTDNSTGTLGLIYWHNFTPVYPVPQVTQAAIMNNITYEIKEILLPKILAVFGHFRCHVSASFVGSVLVNIQLYDHTIGAANGFMEANNILGGLNTSLLGSRTDLITATNSFVPVFNVINSIAHNKAMAVGGRR